MTDLVVWTGPVAKFQVPGATVPGAKELFIGCYGDRPPSCPEIGNQLQGNLGSLLAKASMSESELGDLFLAGFSAGGSILKRVLENPEYRKKTAAVELADATYTSSWINESQRIPPIIEGYVQYGVDVANGPGDKLFIATASPIPNKTWASGVENLRELRHEIERRTGKTFTERADFFGVTPFPDHLYQLGNVLLGEYPLQPIGHGHNVLAPQIWQKIIQPWLAKGKGLIGTSGGLPEPGPGPGPTPGPGPGPTPGTLPESRSFLTSVAIVAASAAIGLLVTRAIQGRL